MRKRLSPGVILGVVAVVFACAGSATAGSLITTGKIKDGTIQGRDIKQGTITSDRLASNVQTKLKQITKPGLTGAKGDKGDKGDTGSSVSTGATVLGSAPQPGEKGDTGANGKDALTGSFYAVAYYNAGDTNEGAVATVACNADNDVSQRYIALSGGVQTLGLESNGISANTPVSNSFPGRMDWATNAPKANRLDGWIVQFGGNAQTGSAPADKAPGYVKVWALCVEKSADVPVTTTYTQAG